MITCLQEGHHQYFDFFNIKIKEFSILFYSKPFYGLTVKIFFPQPFEFIWPAKCNRTDILEPTRWGSVNPCNFFRVFYNICSWNSLSRRSWYKVINPSVLKLLCCERPKCHGEFQDNKKAKWNTWREAETPRSIATPLMWVKTHLGSGSSTATYTQWYSVRPETLKFLEENKEKPSWQ